MSADGNNWPLTKHELHLMMEKLTSQVRDGLQVAVKTERERCARILDEQAKKWLSEATICNSEGAIDAFNRASGAAALAKEWAVLIRSGK